MRKSGINMEQVKKENRSIVIKCINNNGPLSRKDIAAHTGLTPASVTQITTKLIKEGVLSELGSVPDSSGLAGRKKVLLDIDPNMGYICAINIESEMTTLAICDMKGCLVHDKKNNDFIKQLKTNCAEDFLITVADECKVMIHKLPASIRKRIKCISVSVPGIVDKESGTSVHAYGIWDREVPLKRILEKELNMNIPIILENNVDAFAMAEILFGAGRIYDSLLIIKWGPGVGSTIIIDSKVYQGRHGKTAELGHFIVEKNGRKCSCGRRGCLETYLSASALSKSSPEEYDAAIDLLARSIVNTCTIIAPNRVILSGKMFADKKLRKQLIDACSSYDPSYDENRLIYTTLSGKENYIGPASVFIASALYSLCLQES